MDASATGSASDSSFEMDSGMTLVETDGGVTVEWWAETDVFGRVAQMGQRVISPVAKRVINRFSTRSRATSRTSATTRPGSAIGSKGCCKWRRHETVDNRGPIPEQYA